MTTPNQRKLFHREAAHNVIYEKELFRGLTTRTDGVDVGGELSDSFCSDIDDYEKFLNSIKQAPSVDGQNIHRECK